MTWLFRRESTTCLAAWNVDIACVIFFWVAFE
jgi:hypothetical protein